jgi:hypothetical protein
MGNRIGVRNSPTSMLNDRLDQTARLAQSRPGRWLFLGHSRANFGREPGRLARASRGNRAQLIGCAAWSQVHEGSEPGHAQVFSGSNCRHDFFRRCRFNIESYSHARVDSSIHKHSVIEQRAEPPDRVAQRDSLPVNRCRTVRCLFDGSAAVNTCRPRASPVRHFVFILSAQAAAKRDHSE